MELLLYHLINHIKESMPSLSLVDEDYGQLEAIDKEDVDTYPVTFPCVLIDIFLCVPTGIFLIILTEFNVSTPCLV